MKKLKKMVKIINGEKMYFLGEDGYGVKYYVIEPKWDCNWYWGFGYIHTSDNQHLHLSNMIDELFGLTSFRKDKNSLKTPFTMDEKWTLFELFQTAYQLKRSAGIYLRGGSNIAHNPLRDIIKNKDEYLRINKIVLPAIFDEIRKILEPEEAQEKKSKDLQ